MTSPSSADPLISVIICTHNRAELLRLAIDSIVAQNFPRDGYELIVVDNASSDHTNDIVKAAQPGAPVRYVREDRIGLCHARNTGMDAAAGRYLAYFDDDALASPGWLESIKTAFETAGPDIGIVGGPVTPLWEIPAPDWLPADLAASLTIIDWGHRPRVLKDIDREWLVGTNMAIPRSLLKEIGGFDSRLDRMGEKLLSSGDILLQREVQRRGRDCFYWPEMSVQHLIPAARLQQAWFYRRYFWQGVSNASLLVIETLPSETGRRRMAAERAGRIHSPDEPGILLIDATGPEDFRRRCWSLFDVGYLAGLLGAAGY